MSVEEPAHALATDVDWYAPQGTANGLAAGNVLVYSPAFRPKMRFSIGDGTGQSSASGETATYRVMHVSPDGHAASVNRLEENREFNVLLMDLSSGTSSRLMVSGPTGDSSAIFSPDGKRLVLDVNDGHRHELWTQRTSRQARATLESLTTKR